MGGIASDPVLVDEKTEFFRLLAKFTIVMVAVARLAMCLLPGMEQLVCERA